MSYTLNETGGVLTVTDGSDTLHLTLVGTYDPSQFVLGSNGNGGSVLTALGDYLLP